LKGVIDYWIGQGVRIFRVDNPHTKTLYFWEWVMAEIRPARPDVIFLAEAFTRPRVMYGLAKMGFNQSYNYFPWRNSKAELTDYFTELSRPPVSDFFRANLWPNTPDILPYSLQDRGRPCFAIRLLLAATLGTSYGIYGPAYELLENQPLKAGSEEYLNSEKYEIRHWELDQPGNLTDLISRLNRIRRENAALHAIDRLHFHPVHNEALIAYSKTTRNFDNVILTVVNLDPDRAQGGWLNLALDKLGVGWNSGFEVHDLLTDARYPWHGSWNYVELRPGEQAAHVFRVRPAV
jgi:starch synthase (maltosyl-transferring)